MHMATLKSGRDYSCSMSASWPMCRGSEKPWWVNVLPVETLPGEKAEDVSNCHIMNIATYV